jgi:hypothetical protein
MTVPWGEPEDVHQWRLLRGKKGGPSSSVNFVKRKIVKYKKGILFR